MKKLISGFVTISTVFSLVCNVCATEEKMEEAVINEAYNELAQDITPEETKQITVYALDGRTETIYEYDLDKWKNVGWYEEPVCEMYAVDGRTAVVPVSDVEEWKNVWWYEEPVCEMYAVDGRTAVVPVSDVEEWKKVWWYEEPVRIMYSADDRTAVVPVSKIAEWKKVGWYDSPVTEKNSYVNLKGLSSKTDYLVWISKSEYKVRVYVGTKGNWKLVKTFTCAIGKPSTPTCEGTYTYYQAQKMWDYGSYYVGPIMRFNGGYAIHSTLIYKDGTPKDNHVGMKLSLGCIRLQPADINWMASYVPLNTTIHITA